LVDWRLVAPESGGSKLTSWWFGAFALLGNSKLRQIATLRANHVRTAMPNSRQKPRNALVRAVRVLTHTDRMRCSPCCSNAGRLGDLRASGIIHVMIDWSACPAVERDPERVSGAWVFRGTRVPVAALFENLEDGALASQFVEWFPGVTIEQVRGVLEHAARSALAPA
jgi:uncharacterized protein (DUF433 family)